MALRLNALRLMALRRKFATNREASRGNALSFEHSSHSDEIPSLPLD
jgi:hypothetical protein